MAWCRSGDKPLSEPMMVSLLTHICVTRPQWVKRHTSDSYIWLETVQETSCMTCLINDLWSKVHKIFHHCSLKNTHTHIELLGPWFMLCHTYNTNWLMCNLKYELLQGKMLQVCHKKTNHSYMNIYIYIYTVRCRYWAVIFLQNIHNRHP